MRHCFGRTAMCGFSGLFSNGAAGDLRAVVARMSATLAARGPDASGIYADSCIALGHRRLSILDLSEAGAQPMSLVERGVTLVFNGEIYNFRELREELRGLGHRFVTRTDTEVILHSYDAWGLSGLKRLEGIFGFALWDKPHRRLVLMRDRLGVKPVFFGQSSLGLAFGSEIKAVLEAGGVDRTLDDQSLREYLWYGNPYGDRTFYTGIRALEPGHWLVIDGTGQKLEPWWRIEEWVEPKGEFRRFDDAVLGVRRALDAAVERQLVADVPVAIFLSGGVDSSAIAASAVRASTAQLISYATGFDFRGSTNELPKAAAVARHLGLDHRELKVNGVNMPEVLVDLAKVYDEPFADAASIPLYLMCKALDRQVKVVLQGDGGDELFGGYRRYSLLRNSWFWARVPRSISRVFRKAGSLGARFARLADSVGHDDPAMRMALLLTTEQLADPPEALFCESRRRHLEISTDPFLAYRAAARRFPCEDPVQQMLLTDLTVQLPSQFLTKVDRATMAAGIEARVPILDETVAKIAVGLPTLWKVKGVEKKILLRESERGRLPDFVLDAPKTGFGVPYGYWLRSSLAEFARERLLDGAFLRRLHLTPSAVDKAIIDHQSGAKDRGFLLWKLLQLQLWDERQH